MQGYFQQYKMLFFPSKDFVIFASLPSCQPSTQRQLHPLSTQILLLPPVVPWGWQGLRRDGTREVNTSSTARISEQHC